MHQKRIVMKLIPFDTTRLQSLESAQFINRFLIDYKKKYTELSEDADFVGLHTELIHKASLYSKSVKQSRAKIESITIMELDRKRKQKTTTLFWALQVYTYSDDADEKKSFEILKGVKKEFYKLKFTNLEARTLNIDNLISNLRSEMYLQHAQLLGLEKHINTLETANGLFKTVFNVRSSLTINEKKIDNAGLRLDIFRVYKDLCEYVEVMARQKKKPFYEEVLKIINNGRDYYKVIIAKRKGVKKARSKKNSEKEKTNGGI